MNPHFSNPKPSGPEVQHLARLASRRQFIHEAARGTLVVALGGGVYFIDDDMTRLARAAERGDGRPRLPPGQRVISALKPMGGAPGDPRRSQYRLKVHGEVEKPFELDFQELQGMPQVDQTCDVHCVTSWSVLDAKFRGVRVRDLAERAKLKQTARHVVFEAAHDYTSNVPLAEALAPNVLVAHALAGEALPRTHGGPARAVIPDLYFWKSAKWLTGIKFVARDEPGYWETRGYHNHGDPWREERYA
jgi:DMSO/TMAO reductase YedYZ molybdopterin-dependent catalytic subunit